MTIIKWIRVQWDRAGAVLAAAVGLVALLVGWLGVSGEAYVAKQIPYIVSGALFGIFMLGVAAVLWLSADLRDEWREMHAVRELLAEQGLQLPAKPGSDQVAPAPTVPTSPTSVPV